VKYTVILFDLDGTLIDTNNLILSSFMHTLETHCPGKYTEQDVLACMGEPLLDQMRRFDPSQAEEMVKTYHAYNVAKHDELVASFPHVREVLTQLHEAGVVLAVVSNKRRLVVDMGLKRMGLDHLMSAVVTVDDVKRGKPEPDMILFALDKLQATAEQALMVGDSRYDLMAAERAGVVAVGVAWSLHADELKRLAPAYFIDDMRQLLDIVQIQSARG
jgi:pyrophosphatase PpaX